MKVSFRILKLISKATFQAVCKAYGFLQDDKRCYTTLDEAAKFASGSKLRKTFFCHYNCLHGNP